MTLNFNIKSLNNVIDEKSIFTFSVKTLNKNTEVPSDILQLKDSQGNYLYDSNNNKLFVRR